MDMRYLNHRLMRCLIAALIACTFTTMSACNTMEGAGEDLEEAGDEIEDAAD